MRGSRGLRTVIETLAISTGPLRNRNFRLLWIGQTASQIGNGAFNVALAIEALRLDGHPAGLALILAARIAPAVILLPFGGLLADRLARRRTLLVADAARALAVSTVGFAIIAGADSVWLLIAMSIVFGVANAMFAPALVGMVPELIGKKDLVAGSSLNAASQEFGQTLLGPIVGGAVVAVGGTGDCFLFNGATFVLSTIALFILVAPKGITRKAQRPDVWSELKEGLGFVARTAWLRNSTILTAMMNFLAFSTYAVLIPVYVRESLHASPEALGLVFACGGLGGLAAAAAGPRIRTRTYPLSSVLLCFFCSAVSFSLVGLVSRLWLVAVLSGLSWALMTLGNVLAVPLLQGAVPQGLVGRVASVDLMMSLALSPAGIVVAGVVAGGIGPGRTIVVDGALAAACAVLPGMRRLRGYDTDIVKAWSACDG